MAKNENTNNYKGYEISFDANSNSFKTEIYGKEISRKYYALVTKKIDAFLDKGLDTKIKKVKIETDADIKKFIKFYPVLEAFTTLSKSSGIAMRANKNQLFPTEQEVWDNAVVSVCEKIIKLKKKK